MRALLLTLLVAATLSLFGQQQAGAPWFGDVRKPLTVSETAMTSFTEKLRAALKSKNAAKKLPELLPIGIDACGGDTPRVLFLTLGDGRFPSRTYYAAGKNFRETLTNLLTIVAKREPEYAAAIRADLEAQVALAQQEKRTLPDSVKKKLSAPNDWESLRLDIVQATLPNRNFVVNSSRLLLSSAVGIAFDQTAAFAFTPEQLTGRYLMTTERQLSVSRIANLISEANIWDSLNLWLRMGGVETPFLVTLFEIDSYYADASGARRLFRAHPARLCGQPSAASAVSLAKRTAELLSAQKGTILPPFPEWVVARSSGKTALFDQAALALALLDAAELADGRSQRTGLLSDARLAVKPLLKAIKHLDPKEQTENGLLTGKDRRKSGERAFAMIVEDEDNPNAGDFEQPARVSELRTNALTYLVFSRMAQILPKEDKTANACRKELEQLYRHIALQCSENGDCIPAVLYPTRAARFGVVGGEDLSAAEGIETAALAGLAMEEHRRNFPEADTPALREALRALREALGKRAADNSEGADAVPLSPWVVRFLAQDAVTADGKTPNAKRLAQLARLAVVATRGLECKPALPDMFGCDADIPSMTYAAERLETTAAVVEALANAGQPENALSLLQDAWPLWCFQQQATMFPETASVLPQPDKYLGLQRDNLADFGFTLNGQTTQISAQMQLLRTLAALRLHTFDPTTEQRRDWDQNWLLIDTHPLCLAPELVLPGQPGEENRRTMAGSLGKATTTTFKKETPAEKTTDQRVIRKRK